MHNAVVTGHLLCVFRTRAIVSPKSLIRSVSESIRRRGLRIDCLALATRRDRTALRSADIYLTLRNYFVTIVTSPPDGVYHRVNTLGKAVDDSQSTTTSCMAQLRQEPHMLTAQSTRTQRQYDVIPPAPATRGTVAEALVTMLADLGVTAAFGICGGAIAPLWDALEHSHIRLMHFRHEAGAAFAATEAYLTSGSPVAVCVTSGPGITNALTGLLAARSDGAKVILVSGCTTISQVNRTPMQETTPQTLGVDMFAAGPLFHYGVIVEASSDLVEIRRKLAEGLQRKGSFVAHVSLSVAIQKSPASVSINAPLVQTVDPQASPEDVRSCVDILRKERTAIWLGFGARHAAKEVYELVERIDAPVFCSPRAKGIFPESHPLFVGVTGFGGDRAVLEFMREHRPERVLVLGSRLGEMTSFWNPEMIPPRGLIHVDIDPTVPGASYPDIPTIAVHSEIGTFLAELLTALGRTTSEVETKRSRSWHLGISTPVAPPPDHLCAGPVRPQLLLQAVQRVVVEESSAIVLAEAGNAFAWATQRLRFNSPGRYRISTSFASMGHAGTGVLGSAYASGRKAVALVGDGTMLMNNEISTAVQYRIPAVWVILNDSGYGMIDQGMTQCGYRASEISLPPTNFAAIARAMGAYGRRVEEESEVQEALSAAMTVAGPAVVDVHTDPRCKAPIGGRVTSIVDQSST
ncbi:thiamine pyrophosphate-dependent enzyme [Mycobacterium sp. E3247]|uniref:thiamine pyrophosphate-dependent enzyme n=1 Tax=Mycobacterium sp. E3247 TaxID=1856864 RepID=UPI001E41EB0F|nr:thiamine pyrophosphate-dependent enzyme [Mycobacterium sp. E3247]